MHLPFVKILLLPIIISNNQITELLQYVKNTSIPCIIILVPRHKQVQDTTQNF